MRKYLVTAAIAAVGVLFAGAALAQPSSSSLQLVVVSSQSGAAPTAPTFGSQVTFDVKTTSSQPWVSVACYQNGAAVYGQYWGFWNGYDPVYASSTTATGGVFTLGPTAMWSSGGASCVASLYTVGKNGKQTSLASLNFTVAG